ncbi:MAG: polysaccharide pyruvyl transferase family protein [Butyrivibrio sp.]|nr:polysaccharide pyruvyl transferase family protein [Acetatifactor muris]MCM1558916.1 polysaccharide pyruvyl transferase family protein [Butyrivibrio sp.]
MKIMVMTYWDSNTNYGQQLQIYALQKKLEGLGHEVTLLRYHFVKNKYDIRRIMSAFNFGKLIKYIEITVRHRKAKAEEEKNSRQFQKFRSKHLRMTERDFFSTKEMNDLDAQCVITGSDQVWNWEWKTGSNFVEFANAYFLGFVRPGIHRISYAASWGGKVPNKSEEKLLRKLLAQFDLITVREDVGIKTCAMCGRTDSDVVPDPTLLLNAEDYRKLYVEEEMLSIDEPYVFFYHLNNRDDFNINGLYDWAREKNLRVVYVTANAVVDSYEKVYPTIPQWLYLIEHAEYVVTNSFHGCVFSLIFNKKFGVIKLSGRSKEMNCRLDSLFFMCHVNPRYIERNNFDVLDMPAEKISVDYAGADKVWTKLEAWNETIK